MTVVNITIDTERSYGRECLALVAFAEARDQGTLGMAAVMQVAINRATDSYDRWPKTLCGVVQQPGQFLALDSWKYPRVPNTIDVSAWIQARVIADNMINHTGPNIGSCGLATYFDRGGNTLNLNSVCKLGKHTFYRATRTRQLFL